MSWYRKDTTTPFEQAVIPGLFFLDGDLVSEETQTMWTKGMKFPLVEFPSGVACEVWTGNSSGGAFVIHLFGEMDLLLFSHRNAGFQQAFVIAEQVGYGVKKIGEHELEVVGQDRGEHLIVTYDNERQVIVDVRHAPRPTVAARPPLLDEQSRAQLPKLYSGEENGLGLEAVALVKFFTPDSNWTWYASEFDGEDIFFGLVIGYEIELGYFTLTELTEVRGPFGLSIERDKFYQPKTLAELEAQHQQERRNE